jgi:hypothetical protein
MGQVTYTKLSRCKQRVHKGAVKVSVGEVSEEEGLGRAVGRGGEEGEISFRTAPQPTGYSFSKYALKPLGPEAGKGAFPATFAAGLPGHGQTFLR